MATNDVKKTFGATLKGWRKRMGYSQEVLAERSDLHRTYISDVERGARNLSLESITRLAEALDISVAALFPDELNSATTSGNGHTELNQSFVEILLVEDNAADVDLTLRAFKQARFANRVTVVTDGQAALDYLFRRGPHADQSPAQRPQVILLDLSLPKVSGLEVLRQIKSDPQVSTAHVIILSASNYQEDMARCRRLGAEDYLTKPVDFQGLSRVTPQLRLNWALFKPAAEVIRSAKTV